MALTGCGGTSAPPGPSFTLDVAAPSDPSCIGVVGFEVSVTSGTRTLRSQIVLDGSAVLTTADCRLASAVSTTGVDPTAPLDVEVRGYDGVHQLLVSGAAHVDSLDAPGATEITLAASGVSGHPVLVLDRAALFPGLDLGGVDGVTIRSQRSNVTLLDVPVSASIRPFFSVGEPSAFVLGQSPPAGEELAVSLTAAHGAPSLARVEQSLDPSGLFLKALPR